MRIGLVTRAGWPELDRLQRLGMRSTAWMAFADSPAAPGQAGGDDFARRFADAAEAKGIRISAIGAFYRNALDPAQTERARAVILRAIEVAALIGVRTVSGFSGGIIEARLNERGGNPVYQHRPEHIPAVLAFWEPLARAAADRGLRIAFEHCPQGLHALPVLGYNLLATPGLWERFFDATSCPNLGLEWDPSHLVCQLIDPVDNLRQFGSKVFHVHAKDAWVNQSLLRRYGICHPGVLEHRFPGFGQSNWAEIVHELVRQGYDSDLNIEGWHDPVFRNHGSDAPAPLAHRELEDAGALAARRWLEPLVPPISD